MKVTFLGTGTSQGVPVIGCDCEVCTSVDFRDNRLRSSVHVDVDELSIVIDAGPDFRQQMLQNRIKNLDALLLTHEHKDHTAGLDDIRPFYFENKQPLPVYARNTVIDQLKKAYAYIFSDSRYPGIPKIDVKEIKNKPFRIKNTTIRPVEVLHHKLPVFGFRIGDFTYITDAKSISDEESEKIIGSKVLVLNALQKKPHISHFTLDEALEFIEKIKPSTAYLTHISHTMGLHAETEKLLPENVFIAYDGLKISI